MECVGLVLVKGPELDPERFKHFRCGLCARCGINPNAISPESRIDDRRRLLPRIEPLDFRRIGVFELVKQRIHFIRDHLLHQFHSGQISRIFESF